MARRDDRGSWVFLRALGRGIDAAGRVVVNLIFIGALLLLAFVLWSGRERPIQDDSVLVLKPQGELVEQFSASPKERAMQGLAGGPASQVQVRDLVAAIDAAASDRRITRILLEPEDLRAGGFASLREVAGALDRFRAAGKPVIAWASGLDQNQYYLAAHADRILLDPMGEVELSGLAEYRLFYKNLLDRLGVNVHLFRVGQFKSAAEPFVLDHASPESKEAASYWMNGLWDRYLDEVARLRRMDPAKLRAGIEGLPEAVAASKGDLGRLAVEQGLADGLMTRDGLEKMLRKEGVPAGSDGEGFRQVDLDGYAAQLPSGDSEEPGVAIVVAEGEITGGEQPPGVIGGDSTAALIRAARASHDTKALVLRVNSPGGDVYASEQIRREVELTRQAGIPVVVSMGDTAASGGYWISMNADRIFAEPNTVTGSIGIFGMLYDVSSTLEKLGVKSDGASTGPLAGEVEKTRPLDPRQAALIQATIDKGYRDFVGNVAQARGKDYGAIDAVAQGRVWTGQQALERGLIDQLGGLREAVADAAQRAGLGKNPAVHYAEPPVGAFEQLLVKLNGSVATTALRAYGVRLPAWIAQLPALAPELKLLENTQPGKMKMYAHCFCEPR
ncbi:signal peptide peptidase SppA [Dyella sp. LX-66]|uniref:signal peptide peptidase SppA n=1 Tax=unclassified Dyella TaxID=2634549 RepID=UPI001BE09F1D|nr:MULTISPECIES: signal peptide peptidase SppA [unclassified Dyella]MBT2115864.1 signal peptide peptidase SppA [Dyella sp. LX-1]MBT2139679.1 signal peptide peptidase SppA [Dyella sp. LX-66]